MNGKRVFLALIIALALVLCTGCGAEKTPERISQIGFFLDTVITLSAHTEDVQALKDALEECGRYEQLLSRTIEGSDVWRINHAGGNPVEVSDDTVAFPQFKTDGASRKGNEKSDDADLLFRILSAILSFYNFSLYHS
ncbi:MAG: FAD:protein FMN transferase [Acidaminococcaceae bacterium]|nr:FAD:protein FMN transferase [Acidaminococcaceae bacterium]